MAIGEKYRSRAGIIILALLLGLGLLAGAWFFIGQAPAGPEVEITSPPSDSEFVVGEEVLVVVSASGEGIERIQLLVDGEVVDQAMSPTPQDTFTAQFGWPATVDGEHTLAAVAYDSAGGESEAAQIIVNVVTSVAEATPTVDTPATTPEATPTSTASPTPKPAATATSTPTPTPTLTPTPTPTPEAVIEFGADDTSLNLFQCTNLWWNVQNIKEVYLIRDGGTPEGVPGGNQTREICPGDDTTFTLRVKKLDDSIVEPAVTIAVQGRNVLIYITKITPAYDGDPDTCSGPSICHPLDYWDGDIYLYVWVFTEEGVYDCYLPSVNFESEYWSIGSHETFKVPASSRLCTGFIVPEDSNFEVHFQLWDVDYSSADDLLLGETAYYPWVSEWKGGPYKAAENFYEVEYRFEIVDTQVT